MEAETVLCYVIRCMNEDKQGVYRADDETIELCEYELKYFLGEASSNTNSARVQEFLTCMKENQLTQAKQLSLDAAADYQSIQIGHVTKTPTNFQLPHWERLTIDQKLNLLEGLKEESNKKRTSLLQQKEKFISRLNVGGHANIDKKANQEVNSHTSNDVTKKANYGDSKLDSSNEMPLTTFLQNVGSGITDGNKDTRKMETESNKTDLSNISIGTNIALQGNAVAVYVADEQTFPGAVYDPGEYEEQGPSLPNAVNADRRSNVSDSVENPVVTLQQNRTLPVYAISTKEDIAEQWYIIYEKKVRQIFKELQEGRRTMPDGIFEEILSLVKKIGNVCETLAKEQMRSMCGVVDSVLGDQTKEPVDKFLLKEFMRQNADISLDVLQRIDTDLEESDPQLVFFIREVNSLSKRMVNTEQLLKITQSTRKTSELLDEFVKLITTIIWYMTIQDKPMVLVYSCSNGVATGTSVFEQFTINGGKAKPQKVKGGRIQRVIWPAVMSFEGGRLLRKGVALFA